MFMFPLFILTSESERIPRVTERNAGSVIYKVSEKLIKIRDCKKIFASF
jgi:hypothetical protein